MSEDTIANAIKGRELRERTLLSIAESLELPLECLTKERLFFVDDYLKREVEPVKMAVDSGTNEKRDGVKDGIKTVKYLYDLSNRIYPSDISEEFELGRGYHITTMPELFIYLPLCKMHCLTDVVSRIGGQIDGYEGYILKQSECLYESIPSIPAKRFADNYLMSFRLDSKEKLSDAEKEISEQLKQYWKSEEYGSDYRQYRDLAQRSYDLYRNDIMQSIIEAKFPDLYSEEIQYRNECLSLMKKSK